MLHSVHDRATARNSEERNLRRDLALLEARYDRGAVPPEIFITIRKLETELAWLEHARGQS